jgi:hypothetical protein
VGVLLLESGDALLLESGDAMLDEAGGGGPVGLAAGVASLSAVGQTTATLSATAATGGTAPYGYQWQRGTTAAGPWSDESGQTSLTASISGLTASTTYYFRLRVTDAALGAATSNVLTVQTSGNSARAARWYPGLLGVR